ncbi:hypothetical protein THIOM_003076 [Candidatus Thiomargarita nelsonii]|uniref:Uncharacterized protein n=1 Tax=Candidatus Thiomargarita nelsonii TaxID=1003181 RepID=A0A176RZD7_9GAMM|nr:hypothetical protein THIOM_003076 [Candidatus Thiomargarita nelsonii]
MNCANIYTAFLWDFLIIERGTTNAVQHKRCSIECNYMIKFSGFFLDLNYNGFKHN